MANVASKQTQISTISNLFLLEVTQKIPICVLRRNSTKNTKLARATLLTLLMLLLGMTFMIGYNKRRNFRNEPCDVHHVLFMFLLIINEL